MAIVVDVALASPISVGTGSSGALEGLGLTRNGAQLTFEGFFEPVYCDDNGGDAGPPVEIQYMGEIAHIRLPLTKFDQTIAAKIVPRILGGTAGTPGAAGTLLFAGGLTYRVLVNSPNLPYNFPRCVFQEPFEFNRGTKYTEWMVVATAYKDANGVLWNRTTS